MFKEKNLKFQEIIFKKTKLNSKGTLLIRWLTCGLRERRKGEGQQLRLCTPRKPNPD